MARNTRRIDAQLDALYAEIPRMACRGLCQASCGPIGMALRERQRAEAALGGPVTVNEHMTCTALKNGRCSIYDVRPMICRVWGSEETMPCPWGCPPERYLTHAEGSSLVQRSIDIGGEDPEEMRRMLGKRGLSHFLED